MTTGVCSPRMVPSTSVPFGAFNNATEYNDFKYATVVWAAIGLDSEARLIRAKSLLRDSSWELLAEIENHFKHGGEMEDFSQNWIKHYLKKETVQQEGELQRRVQWPLQWDKDQEGAHEYGQRFESKMEELMQHASAYARPAIELPPPVDATDDITSQMAGMEMGSGPGGNYYSSSGHREWGQGDKKSRR